MQRILFVCARNRLRSPTAEAVFGRCQGLEVASAGTAPDAECHVSADLLEWANLIVAMERRQVKSLQSRFGELLKSKRIVCLGIPDRFDYMQPELVAALNAKVLPLLT